MSCTACHSRPRRRPHRAPLAPRERRDVRGLPHGESRAVRLPASPARRRGLPLVPRRARLDEPAPPDAPERRGRLSRMPLERPPRSCPTPVSGPVSPVTRRFTGRTATRCCATSEKRKGEEPMHQLGRRMVAGVAPALPLQRGGPRARPARHRPSPRPSPRPDPPEGRPRAGPLELLLRGRDQQGRLHRVGLLPRLPHRPRDVQGHAARVASSAAR